MTDRPVVVQVPAKKVDYMAKINSAFSDFENVLSERQNNQQKVEVPSFKRPLAAADDTDDSDSDDLSDVENVENECAHAEHAGGSDLWKRMMSKYL